MDYSSMTLSELVNLYLIIKKEIILRTFSTIIVTLIILFIVLVILDILHNKNN